MKFINNQMIETDIFVNTTGNHQESVYSIEEKIHKILSVFTDSFADKLKTYPFLIETNSKDFYKQFKISDGIKSLISYLMFFIRIIKPQALNVSTLNHFKEENIS